MDDLFLALFFVSLVALIVGIVKPSLFSRIFRKDMTRKKLGLIFGSTAVILLILFGVTSETKPSRETIQSTSQQIEQTEETSQPTQQETTSQPQTQPQAESQSQPESKPQATWQKVKSWSGSGIKKTESFEITGNQWRINWTNRIGEYGGILQIFVYRVGSEVMEDLLANTTENTSDTSYIYKSGNFYLNINSANTNWAVEVEELR